MNHNKRGLRRAPREALPSPEVLDWDWGLVGDGYRASDGDRSTDPFLLKTTFYALVKPPAARVYPLMLHQGAKIV